MQLVEFHANTNYYVTAGDVVCDAFGGLMYGEVALYTRMLSTEEIDAAEAYFAKKWFDIDTPGYGSAATAVVLSIRSPGLRITLE